jgi:putative hydrolase of the HAD superfamily
MVAVTFDVDGTLYDLGRQRLRALPGLVRHLRVVQSWRRQTEALRGQRVPNFHAEVHRRISDELGLSLDRVEAAVQRSLGSAWLGSFHEGTPLAGIGEVLDALDAKGTPRAVVSDHPGKTKLEAMGLGQGWAAIVDCSALGALKPLPDGLVAAAAAMSVSPADILHIGDRDDTDGDMARTAGASLLLRGRDWNTASDLLAALGLAPGQVPT